MRRSGRIENNQVVVERWIHNEGRHTKTLSLREEYQDVRFERPLRVDEYEHGRKKPYNPGDHFDNKRDYHD